MSFTPDQIARVAQRVATQVRRQIPRSSNRYLTDDITSTDWLHVEDEIEYTKFIQSIARLNAEGGTQKGIQHVTKKSIGCMRTKKISSTASVSDLKHAIRDFLRDGRIDGKAIDLRYKPNLNAEKEYSRKFGAALAEYLNKRGFRNGKHLFTPEKVMWTVSDELFRNDRGLKGHSLPSLPLTYIRSSALNASRFGVGNCEECGCAAFATLLTLPAIDNHPIGNERIRMELVYGMSDSSAHYFVLLNRSGANSLLQDFAQWFDDPSVVVCDPWVIDQGLGAKMTTDNAGMRELRSWLKPNQKEGPETLRLRATGYIGQSDGLKSHDNFVLQKAVTFE